MAKKLTKVIVLLTMAMVPFSAYSQQQRQVPGLAANQGTERAAVAPTQFLPSSSRDVFPKLPRSSVCMKEKLIGMWKLLMVYEIPAGREITKYIDNPLQYMVFEADNRFGEYASMLHVITLDNVRNTALNTRPGTPIVQYSVNQSGMLFFYKNSVAVDSLACFIVAQTSAPFRKGQVLLMPPEKSAAGGRMLKVYEKVFKEFEAPYNPPVGSASPAAMDLTSEVSTDAEPQTTKKSTAKPQ